MALEEMFKALEWLNSAIQKQEARSEPSIDEMSTLLEDAKSPLAEVIESIPTVLHKLFTALAPDGALDERYAGDPYSRKVIINALRLHNYLDSAALNELFYVKTSLQLASEIDEYMGEIREHLHWLAPGATDWCQEVFQGGGAVAELGNIKATLEDIDAALEKLDKQVWSGSSNIIEEAKSLREKLVAALPSALTELCDAWSTDGKIIESRSSSFRNAFELFAAGIAVADYAGVSTSHLKSLKAQRAVSQTLKRSARLNAEHNSAATAEIEAFEAEKRARQSVEAALPEGTTWTFAQQYVLQPGAESLVGLVGEKLEAMPDASIVRVAPPGHSLIVHRADRGYVSDLGSLLQQLVTFVRRAVSAVEVDDEDQEDLDKTMQSNLKRVRTLAGNIKESMVEAALISHLRFNPANVLTLDTHRARYTHYGYTH